MANTPQRTVNQQRRPGLRAANSRSRRSHARSCQSQRARCGRPLTRPMPRGGRLRSPDIHAAWRAATLARPCPGMVVACSTTGSPASTASGPEAPQSGRGTAHRQDLEALRHGISPWWPRRLSAGRACKPRAIPTGTDRAITVILGRLPEHDKRRRGAWGRLPKLDGQPPQAHCAGRAADTHLDVRRFSNRDLRATSVAPVVLILFRRAPP